MRKAIIAVMVALASVAAANLGSVISSFRLSGASLPYVTGVTRSGYYEVEYWGTLYSAGPDYILRYNEAGSIIGSYVLTGSSAPADMDLYYTQTSYDIATFDKEQSMLLYYTLTTGSLLGSRPVPANTNGFSSIWDHRFPLLAIGTWVFRHDRNWSIVNSFDTGMDIAAIGGADYFLNKSWATVIVAPQGQGPFHCYYVSNGSHAASFTVPGLGTRGASCGSGSAFYFYCSRLMSSGDTYLYKIDIEGYSGVEPASLGRVKAVFK